MMRTVMRKGNGTLVYLTDDDSEVDCNRDGANTSDRWRLDDLPWRVAHGPSESGTLGSNKYSETDTAIRTMAHY